MSHSKQDLVEKRVVVFHDGTSGCGRAVLR